ncbi:MAG: hypothetical protein F2667_01955 [Actinobacteria bacterium]|uniref:Unannotated protein n=1 Tax=freshwater metagenome TaxID=449393 RepID=A0A6J6NVS2_9ZZZZ|nr:hypothetical protein [Actinomycetota bacterium]
MPRPLTGPRLPRAQSRHQAAAALAAVLALGPVAYASDADPATVERAPDGPDASGISVTDLSASWSDSSFAVGGTALPATFTASTTVSGQVVAGSVVSVRVVNGAIAEIPLGCAISDTLVRNSYLDDDGRLLACRVPAGTGSSTTVGFAVVPDGGGLVSATVRWEGTRIGEAGRPDGPNAGSRPPDIDEDRSVVATTLPSRVAMPVEAAASAAYRFVSSPDFANADVADLSRGPNNWRGQVSNGTNDDYRTAMRTVLDDWSSLDPDSVLVAGDLVEGHWGEDPGRDRIFGPTGTRRQRQAAVLRAAATYYPQWVQRFRDAGLDVYPAVGDHEYADNPWRSDKLQLMPTYARAFARWVLGSTPADPAFADRPSGPASLTAYAFRPRPDIQVVSLDEFDHGPRRMRLRVDRRQLAWLGGVLREARADGVTWVFVQGHLPIVGPVREDHSSGLHLEGGARSPLWRLFTRYGVDVYLCGEVHATTVSVVDGVVQIAHGGALHHGLTNYLVADVRADRVDIDLRDYVTFWTDDVSGRRLWSTRRAGMPPNLYVDPDAFTVGTLTLSADGSLTRRSGLALPWDGRDEVQPAPVLRSPS